MQHIPLDLPPEALQVIGSYVLQRLGRTMARYGDDEPPELLERPEARHTLGAFMLTSKACYAAFHDLEELAGRMLRASFLKKQLDYLPTVTTGALSLFMRNGSLQMTYQRFIFFAAPGSKKCPRLSISIDINEQAPINIISTELLTTHQRGILDKEGDLYVVMIEPLVLPRPPLVVFEDSCDSY